MIDYMFIVLILAHVFMQILNSSFPMFTELRVTPG